MKVLVSFGDDGRLQYAFGICKAKDFRSDLFGVQDQ